MKKLKELRELLDGVESYIECDANLLNRFEKEEDCLHHASLCMSLQRGAFVRFRAPSEPEGKNGVFVGFDEYYRCLIMHYCAEDKSLDLAHVPPAGMIFEG